MNVSVEVRQQLIESISVTAGPTLQQSLQNLVCRCEFSHARILFWTDYIRKIRA
jgi:hypothetical protein